MAKLIYTTANILLFVNIVGGLSHSIINQIASTQNKITSIKNYVLKGAGKNEAYNNLETFVDTFGPRLSGSKVLEESIDYLIRNLKTNKNLDLIDTEIVKVPNWTPMKCIVSIKKPKVYRHIKALALGSSVGTQGHVTATIVVVRNFKEMEAKKDEVRGKIVVYNQPWLGKYALSAIYRRSGASKAAALGAKACLIRSATPFSLQTLHAGSQIYEKDVTKIPALSITVEDAEYLQRLYDKNPIGAVELSLDVNIKTGDELNSRNIVAEIKGSKYPEQVLIFGAHTDSWNLGDGSMDDGAGVYIAIEALNIISNLQKKPLRTIRLVLWTSEETSFTGAKEYFRRHKNESDNVSMVMESDHGVFKPEGIQLTGSYKTREILQTILNTHLSDLNMTRIVNDGSSSDTSFWIKEKQVPGIELLSKNEKYFYYHHSEGDTLSVLDPEHLDLATILWSTILYNVASLEELLPRK